jgi:hypothetical protein
VPTSLRHAVARTVDGQFRWQMDIVPRKHKPHRPCGRRDEVCESAGFQYRVGILDPGTVVPSGLQGPSLAAEFADKDKLLIGIAEACIGKNNFGQQVAVLGKEIAAQGEGLSSEARADLVDDEIVTLP